MQPRHSLQTLSDTEKEPEELVRFREAWKAELQQKRAHPTGPQDHQHDVPVVAAARTSSSSRASEPRLGSSSNTIVGTPSTSIHASHGTSITASRPLSSALEAYRHAVQCEQQSQLDDALRLYRQAFRLDPNVDKAYHKEEMSAQLLTARPVSAAGPIKSVRGPGHKKAASSTVVDGLTQRLGALAPKSSSGVDSLAAGTLSSMLSNWSHHLSFDPEDEKEGVPINLLPDEMLVLILRTLDHTTIERFGTMNRKARIVSLDSTIWRELVEMTYNPPQIPDKKAMDAIVDRYLSDYRRIYIEQPRVRFDGVYIAVCHYVRPGLSENAWVNISHLITYHRYLRFFPNGEVLSLLANEELEPQQIIPLLKPSLRMKGLFIGSWRLSDTTVQITDLADASGRYRYPPQLPTPALPSDPRTTPRYNFQMTLALRSRPLGRWNKLDFEDYDSVDVESGEVTPLALKHERPFWFSKVRSWTM